MKKILLATFMASMLWSCTPKTEPENLTQFVNPFIGTAYHGHTYPGAAVPFGMIQLSPDNGTAGWDWCSGYHYSDSLIAGFSHTHLSGTGIGDLADISVMPTNKAIDGENFKEEQSFTDFYRSRFSHNNEKATPGYYEVLLDDDNIKAELTVTQRVGFHRYTFNNPNNKSIIFDLGFHINWDHPQETYFKVVKDDLVVGYRFSKGWAEHQKVFFAARFSQPFSKFEAFLGERTADEVKGQYTKGVFSFDDAVTAPVMLKVAISSAGIDGALKNLEADNNKWNFDKVVKLADQTWEKELGKIEVTTPDKNLKTIFYTALYHSFLAPYTFSDVDGAFKGYNHQPRKAEGYTKYTVLSLWDTFRALKPLYTIVNPQLTNNIVKSMLDQYDQTGLLPVWELTGNETNCMIGYNAIPVVADAILKGIGDFDREKAFDAMKASSVTDIAGVDDYMQYGYIPSDKENESASKTLEYAYDDWCIAQVARFLGKEEEYQTYMKRSQSYRQLFDKEIKFIRGRLSDGEWATPFDPKFSRHRNDYFTEGNSWQWTWFVPHDVEGLIELMGGKEAFVIKLDQLFNEDSEIKGEHASSDISGLIGQYAHGNEPSHHIAYLYNIAGKPWKTQEYVNQILTTLYTTATDGLCGNEDCGQMSAWYAFSALGFYPMNATDGKYQFGSPKFEKAEIQLSNGKIFTVTAENVSAENFYIRKVMLNGQPLDRTYITHQEIMNGGHLKFVMRNQPVK